MTQVSAQEEPDRPAVAAEEEPDIDEVISRHLLEANRHLARASEMVERFHGPIGIQAAGLAAAHLDIAMANSRNLAALTLMEENGALTAEMLRMLVTGDISPAAPATLEPQPRPSGLVVPG